MSSCQQIQRVLWCRYFRCNKRFGISSLYASSEFEYTVFSFSVTTSCGDYVVDPSKRLCTRRAGVWLRRKGSEFLTSSLANGVSSQAKRGWLWQGVARKVVSPEKMRLIRGCQLDVDRITWKAARSGRYRKDASHRKIGVTSHWGVRIRGGVQWTSQLPQRGRSHRAPHPRWQYCGHWMINIACYRTWPFGCPRGIVAGFVAVCCRCRHTRGIPTTVSQQRFRFIPKFRLQVLSAWRGMRYNGKSNHHSIHFSESHTSYDESSSSKNINTPKKTSAHVRGLA